MAIIQRVDVIKLVLAPVVSRVAAVLSRLLEGEPYGASDGTGSQVGAFVPQLVNPDVL